MIKLKSLLTELTPDISLDGGIAMADQTPLKNLELEDIKRNIVMFRVPNKNSMFTEGYTLVYFMDSEESANDMKNGKIPYLMFPRGTFYSGGSPITDIWKKKFQKPGTEHILGVLEAITNEKYIYLDMISVRSKYQKNSIAKKMVDILVKNFPNAQITHSSPTKAGEKFNTSYKKTISPEKWGGEK